MAWLDDSPVGHASSKDFASDAIHRGFKKQSKGLRLLQSYPFKILLSWYRQLFLSRNLDKKLNTIEDHLHTACFEEQRTVIFLLRELMIIKKIVASSFLKNKSHLLARSEELKQYLIKESHKKITEDHILESSSQVENKGNSHSYVLSLINATIPSPPQVVTEKVPRRVYWQYSNGAKTKRATSFWQQPSQKPLEHLDLITMDENQETLVPSM